MTHRLFFVFVAIPKQQIKLGNSISNLLAITKFKKLSKEEGKENWESALPPNLLKETGWLV